MMFRKIGLPPISIIGLGLTTVSSEILVPKPPAKIIAFIMYILNIHLKKLSDFFEFKN